MADGSNFDGINAKRGWSEERTQALRSLYAEGLSAAQIARRLGGVTRNAVLGKLHRMGLLRRLAPSAPKTVQPKREPRLRYHKPATIIIARAGASDHTPGAERAPMVVGPDTPPSTAKPWVEREAGQCRWPFRTSDGETFSCCAPVARDGAPYCTDHAAVGRSEKQPRLDAKGLERRLRRFL